MKIITHCNILLLTSTIKERRGLKAGTFIYKIIKTLLNPECYLKVLHYIDFYQRIHQIFSKNMKNQLKYSSIQGLRLHLES